MQLFRTTTLQRVLTLMTALLVIKVTVGVVLKYGDYFPPNFNSDFLRGREEYFGQSYQWAFYPHIASGPVSLILGLILVSDQFRMRYPKWHRTLGRCQAFCVLFVVAPSGLWMAYFAAAGSVAALGFAMLAIATGLSIALGWRAAVQRRFLEHRRWMWRCYLLLCAAVVIRVIGGLATVLNASAAWIDPVAAWVCWLVPLLIFEMNRLFGRQIKAAFAS